MRYLQKKKKASFAEFLDLVTLCFDHCQYISPVNAMHGGGIAIGDLLVLVLLLSLLWLSLLWLLYPIFHYIVSIVDCRYICREIPRMTGHVHVACACA